MQHLSINKRISIIAFTLAGLGLVSELSAVFVKSQSPETINVLLYWLKPLTVGFWNNDLLNHYNSESRLFINYPNLVFCTTMLLSACFYVFSRYRETRLLQFSLAVIVLSKVLLIFSSIVSSLFPLAESISLLFIAYFVMVAAMGFIAWWSLSNINKTKQLAVETKQYRGGEPVEVFIEASKGERFTHLLFDALFCVLTVSPLVPLIEGFLESVYKLFHSEQIAMSVAFITFRTIYYPFFESVFGATPGKFLTGTRVVMDKHGQRPGFKTVLWRTLARFIPFEPFSFFWNANWHDSLTYTQVVREKNTGVKGSRYWLILVGYVTIGLGIYAGMEAYESYQRKTREEKIYRQKKDALEYNLKNMTTDAFLRTHQTTYERTGGDIFLKAEEVKDSSIVFSVIVVTDSYKYTLYQLEQLYVKKKDRLTKIELGKDSLFRACEVEHYRIHEKTKEIGLFGDKSRYKIERIDRLFAPNIRDRGTGSYGKEVRMEITNDGWPATIVEIINLEGQIQWQNLPLNVPTTSNHWYATTHLTGEGFDVDKPYKCQIIAVDSLNQRHTFLLEGVNLDKTITRID